MKKHYFASYLCVITAETLDLVDQKGSDAQLEKKENKEMGHDLGGIMAEGYGLHELKDEFTRLSGLWRRLVGLTRMGITKNMGLVNAWDVADPPVKWRPASGTRQRSLTRAVQCL